MTPQITMAGPALVAELTELVNRVYAEGEKGLWPPGAARTYPAEVASLIERGEIAVARVDGRLAGAVRVRVPHLPQDPLISARDQVTLVTLTSRVPVRVPPGAPTYVPEVGATSA
ncbi:MAG: hypothetical protein ABW000_01550 [Actinoplanes sp.]